MLYLQENLRQQALANVFGTSQPTISRAINNVLGVLVAVLPPPPQPKDLHPQRLYLYVLDGTLVSRWWKNARNLYSREHYKAGHNLQILTDQAGQIFYISEPLRLYEVLVNLAICRPDIWPRIQKGYVGSGCDTPF